MFIEIYRIFSIKETKKGLWDNTNFIKENQKKGLEYQEKKKSILVRDNPIRKLSILSL